MLLTLTVVGGCSTHTEPRTPFANGLEEYLEMRRSVLAANPRLQLSSAEELDDRQNNLAQRLRLLRTGIGQGHLFTTETRQEIRQTLAMRMAAPDASALRSALHDPEVAGIELSVNTVYPAGMPRATMPPGLLEVLPPLPAELAYRFVGRDLLLLDRNTSLILDILPEALPPP